MNVIAENIYARTQKLEYATIGEIYTLPDDCFSLHSGGVEAKGVACFTSEVGVIHYKEIPDMREDEVHQSVGFEFTIRRKLRHHHRTTNLHAEGVQGDSARIGEVS